MEKKRIAVGKVVSTHGHRGEVKVWPWTDFPERYRPGTRLFLAQGDTCLTVARSRQHGKSVIVQFAEIQDLTSAEKLRGAVLEVEPWEVEPLPPGRYYIFQLVGCRVYTEEGEFLGELRDVQQTGANDVFVVVTPEAGEVLIPAVKEVVREIDVEQGIIRVKPIPGLLD